jgi:hypothetical protein
MSHLVQNEGSPALEHLEGFVRLEMSVGWNTGPGHYLLGSQRKIAVTGSTADLDEDLAMVAKMNKVFALSSANYEPGLGGLADGLTICQAVPQLVHADTSWCEEKQRS